MAEAGLTVEVDYIMQIMWPVLHCPLSSVDWHGLQQRYLQDSLNRQDEDIEKRQY